MLQSRLDPEHSIGAPGSVWKRLSETLRVAQPGEALHLAAEFGVDDLPPEHGEFVPPPVGMSAAAISVLVQARESARAISSNDFVAARHLLSALLRPGRVGASVAAYLDDPVGVDVAKLRQGLYNDMAAHGFGEDDPRAWRRHLGLDGPDDDREDKPIGQQPRAGYDADHVRLGSEAPGELVDRLGIDVDVDALSKVAMASDVEPPMSIGLFGDWGSGKTYFMALMDREVRKLEAVARAAHARGEKTVYCRDVAQIHFNAWHFIDTNLWASIVTRIFSELARHFDPSGQKPAAWDEALSQTRYAGERLRKANETLVSAAQRVDEAAKNQERHAEAVREIDKKIEARRLTPPKLREYVAAAFKDPEIQAQVRATSDELGVPEIRGSVDRLTTEFKRARTLSGRIRTVWLKLGGSGASPATKFGMMMLASLIVAVPGVIVWLASTELGETTRLVLTSGASLLGLITDRLTLRPAFDAADSALARLEQVHEAVTEQATHGLRSERDRLLDSRDLAQRRVDAAKQEHESARSEQREAERLRDRVRTGAFIGDFIRQQSEKPDYKDQLGIIDEIRRDFEGLSKLLREVSRDSAEVQRLDRIILYIDDLDRCPTERVIEVLQAIHLLLAFELFVVVVGVDSRWVLHALEEQYSAFGGTGAPSTTQRLRWRTTPQNYLEKIFQVPFTLRPMGSGGFADLIEHLTRENESGDDDDEENELDERDGRVPPPSPRTEVSAPVGLDGPTEDDTTPSTDVRAAGSVEERSRDDGPSVRARSVAEAPVSTGVPVAPAPAPETEPESSRAGTGRAAPQDRRPPAGDSVDEAAEAQLGSTRDELPGSSDGGAAPTRPETSRPQAGAPPRPVDVKGIDPYPPVLVISPDERGLMKRLDELIPTPRAAKRFVNVYRLIKATIPTEATLARFLGTTDRAGYHQAVMLMLAMQAGFPNQAYGIFRCLSRKPTGSWWGLVDGLEPEAEESGSFAVPSLELTGLNDAEADTWRELRRALRAQRSAITMPDDLKPFVDYATVVARFGFVTGRAIAPERDSSAGPSFESRE